MKTAAKGVIEKKKREAKREDKKPEVRSNPVREIIAAMN